MRDKDFIIKKFREVKALGFIPSNRENNTGIGKTFEDYMGVEENNLEEPDLAGFEIKSHREDSNSFVTLFTKSPSFPKQANAYLNKKYGIPYEEPLKAHLNKLHTSMFVNKHNTFLNKFSFRLINDREQKTLRIGVYDIKEHRLLDDTVGYDYAVLKNTLEKKLKNLFYVSAECDRRENLEYFFYNKAEIYMNPSFDRFLDLLERGLIMYDIRIGSYKNGKLHDHGSGFRILQPNIKLLYSDVEFLE